MRITKPEDLKIGQWGSMCCERCLEQILSQEDIEEVIAMWDDTGLESYGVFETKKEILLHYRSIHNPSDDDEYGKKAIAYIDKMLKENEHFYGIAWNWREDTYRATGILENIKKYEDAKEKMFIHNSIEDSKVPTLYLRNQQTENEAIVDVSDVRLPGFIILPVAIITSTLYAIDYGIYCATGNMRKNSQINMEV